ncbi:MAG TPA: hypothetical protein VE666_07390 [Mycobacterium sp.]|nr:hypothetical protein [Mycobacterium sp.]
MIGYAATTPASALGAHITHELDMLFALGRQPAIADEALIAMLDRLDGDGVEVLASRVSRHPIRRAG